MGRSHCKGERGVALPTAIVAALVVSVTALVVLNLTMRRFELSAQRSDHLGSSVASEAGFQYAFARLGLDPAFDTAVRADLTGAGAIRVHVVSPQAVGTNITVPFDGAQRTFAVDEQDLGLRGDRPVHVVIDVFPENPPVGPPRLRIHAYSDYGTGA